jgi:hypothetical protein
MHIWRKVTIIVILALILFIAVYDVVAIRQGGDGASISEVLLAAAIARPIVALVGGVLAGHLSWPSPSTDHVRRDRIATEAVVLLGLLMLFVAVTAGALLLGIALGHSFWNQQVEDLKAENARLRSSVERKPFA